MWRTIEVTETSRFLALRRLRSKNSLSVISTVATSACWGPYRLELAMYFLLLRGTAAPDVFLFYRGRTSLPLSIKATYPYLILVTSPPDYQAL
jgi:hypothetical protein